MLCCLHEGSQVLKTRTISNSHRVTLQCMCGTLLKEFLKSQTSKLWVAQNLPSCGNNFIQTSSLPSLWWLVLHLPTKYFQVTSRGQSSRIRNVWLCSSRTRTLITTQVYSHRTRLGTWNQNLHSLHVSKNWKTFWANAGWSQYFRFHCRSFGDTAWIAFCPE